MKRSSRRWKKKWQMRWKWQRKRLKREKRRRRKEERLPRKASGHRQDFIFLIFILCKGDLRRSL